MHRKMLALLPCCKAYCLLLIFYNICMEYTLRVYLVRLQYILEGQLSLRIDRVWNARSVSPTIATDPMELKEPSDSSNSLLALDGEIANLSGIGMEVSTMLRASLRVNDVTYSCTVQCEKDKGAAFGSNLLPMGKSRLVILCEIPEGLELASVELDMDVAAGSEEYSLHYQL